MRRSLGNRVTLVDPIVNLGVLALAQGDAARAIPLLAEGLVRMRTLGRKERVSEAARQYLNRLSDLLFIAARVLNRAAGVADVQWRHQRKR